MYCPRLPSRSEWAAIRHHHYHLRHWGTPQPDTLPLLMLHGWMDVSASFQFVVDALVQPRHIIAPDWRGFGLTRPQHTDPHGPQPWGHGDHYLFADYLADLDFVLDYLNAQLGRNADAPFDLVGHSMGGNVVMAYAGIRPQRVRRAVNLEGFG
ncbi:MAG: alpha/beta fold hydrolase, partial [Macromonas sp.]